MKGTVTMDHGEGGAATARLIRELFLVHLGGPAVLEDAAEVEGSGRMAMTTDTFVVQPIQFPGGDIGRLSIAGTVNDLAVAGAEPRYITAGFVLEEGLELAVLETVVMSMAAGLPIIAFDNSGGAPEAIDNGAVGMYLQGGVGDSLVSRGKIDGCT